MDRDETTLVIVNKFAGTVRSLGADNARQLIAGGFERAGIAARIEMVSGKDIGRLIDEALKPGGPQTIIVGGGDGTISGVANRMAGSGRIMGVIPLGTMNLFAKALHIPPGLAEAIAALTTAQPVSIDVGRVNGRVFLHHVSFGLQPRMAKIRERLGYGSRLTKIINGLRALIYTILRPPHLKLDAVLDGHEQIVRSPAVVVSNNLFGEGHLPYADRMDGGVLGLYVVNSFRTFHIFRVAGGLLTSHWAANPHVDVQSGHHLEIRSLKSGWAGRRKILASIDGELKYVRAPLRLEIEPHSLKVLWNGTNLTTTETWSARQSDERNLNP